MFQFFLGLRGNFFDEILHALITAFAVDENAVNIVGEKVAHGTLDEVRFSENAVGGRFIVDAVFYFFPLIHEDLEVAHKVGFAAALAGCAQDCAHVVRNIKVLQNGFEALTFLGIGDFFGDTELVRAGE